MHVYTHLLLPLLALFLAVTQAAATAPRSGGVNMDKLSRRAPAPQDRQAQASIQARQWSPRRRAVVARAPGPSPLPPVSSGPTVLTHTYSTTPLETIQTVVRLSGVPVGTIYRVLVVDTSSHIRKPANGDIVYNSGRHAFNGQDITVRFYTGTGTSLTLSVYLYDLSDPASASLAVQQTTVVGAGDCGSTCTTACPSGSSNIDGTCQNCASQGLRNGSTAGECGAACPTGSTPSGYSCACTDPYSTFSGSACQSCASRGLRNGSSPGSCGAACPSGASPSGTMCSCPQGTLYYAAGDSCSFCNFDGYPDLPGTSGCNQPCAVGAVPSGPNCVCTRTGFTYAGGACVSCQSRNELDTSTPGVCGTNCPNGATASGGTCICPFGSDYMPSTGACSTCVSQNKTDGYVAGQCGVTCPSGSTSNGLSCICGLGFSYANSINTCVPACPAGSPGIDPATGACACGTNETLTSNGCTLCRNQNKLNSGRASACGADCPSTTVSDGNTCNNPPSPGAQRGMASKLGERRHQSKQPTTRLHEQRPMEEDQNLYNAPQASSRKLSAKEVRQGLGNLASLPTELLSPILGSLQRGELVGATLVSRALNEHALPRMFDEVLVDPARAKKRFYALVDRLHRLGRLEVDTLIVDERDKKLPAQFKRAMEQMSPTLKMLGWSGGVHRVVPRLPALPQLRRLSMQWSGTLQIWDEEDDGFFGRLLADGTNQLEELYVVTHFARALEGDDEDFRASHVLDLARVFKSQPHLRRFSIADHTGGHWDIPSTITLGEQIPSNRLLQQFGLVGFHCTLSRTVYNLLLDAFPNLSDLMLDISSGGIMEGTRSIPSLRKFTGGMESLLPLDVGNVAAPGQLDQLEIFGSVDYPSVEFTALIHLRPRRLYVSVEVLEGETIKSAVEALLGGLPELERLTLMADPAADVEPMSWSVLFDMYATNLQRLTLELGQHMQHVTNPSATWADKLFERVPKLERFDVVFEEGEGKKFKRVALSDGSNLHCCVL